MCGDYLLSIIRRITRIEDSSVEEGILTHLATFAYAQDPDCRPPVSEKTRTLFRNRLSSAFAHLLSDSSSFSYPCDLVRKLKPDAVKMDDKIVEAKDRALSTMEKLVKKAKKSKDQDKPPFQGLALLYSLVIFQLYDAEPDALSALDELKLCYDKLIKHKETDDSEEAEASEVLVELLLSYISKPSALLRKVAQHVFSAFMNEITAEGLELMTDILKSGESLKGQQEMFDQEPEDGEQMDVDEDSEDEDDEIDSDVEVIEANEEEAGSDDEEDDAESASDADADADATDEEARKLDEALAKALGTHAIDPDAASESDSDADMTDSEMLALDVKLQEIFSHKLKAGTSTPAKKKQEQKDAKTTMINFKSRVLDLLDLYVKKQSTNPQAFALLIPLLQLIRETKSKPLADRAGGIIATFAKAAKSAKGTEAELDETGLLALMQRIHDEAALDPAHAYARAASAASLIVASRLLRGDGEREVSEPEAPVKKSKKDKDKKKSEKTEEIKESIVAKIATVYRDSQIRWVEGGTKMQAAFFVEWVNWCQSHAAGKGS